MISFSIALYCWIAVAWLYFAYFTAGVISEITPQSLDFVLDWIHEYLAQWFVILPILLLPPGFATRRAYRWLEVEKFRRKMGKKWGGRLLMAIGHLGFPSYMVFLAITVLQPGGVNAGEGAGLGLGLAMAAVWSEFFYTLGLALAAWDLTAAKQAGHQNQQPPDVDKVLKKLGNKFPIERRD